jgi:chloramphenicol 3-O-phosphotransferase
MRALVLTGPPAAGKSTIGRLAAQDRPRAAFIDIDDVRHLVVSGHAAPWEGEEGRRQRRLGVLNGCALAANFLAAGIDVVIADVLTDDTAALYRESLPGVLILELVVDLAEARRRAAGRPVHLTPAEFRELHARQAAFTAGDIRLDTTRLPVRTAAARVRNLWHQPSA